METLRIEILTAEAKPLLQQLIDKNMIAITSEETDELYKERFEKLLLKIRSVNPKPTFDEITEEVEKVRQERYEKIKSGS